MSKYSWSKQYEIPDFSFNSSKKTTESKGGFSKLRETIDVSSLKYDSSFRTAQRKMTETYDLSKYYIEFAQAIVFHRIQSVRWKRRLC